MNTERACNILLIIDMTYATQIDNVIKYVLVYRQTNNTVNMKI